MEPPPSPEKAGPERSRPSLEPLSCSAPPRPEKRTRGSAAGPSTPLNVLSAGLGRSGNRKCSSAASRSAQGKGPSLRAQVLKLLDDHKSSRAAMVVHLLFWCIIIMSVIIICLMSSPRFAKKDNEQETLFFIDLAIDGLFIFELLLRIWATGWTGGMDPFMYIDLLALSPFIITLFQLGIEGTGKAQESRLNVLKLVRLLKLARHYEGARVLWGALKLSFEALLVPLYFLLCMILLFAALLYMVEVGETRAARPRARARTYARTHASSYARARVHARMHWRGKARVRPETPYQRYSGRGRGGCRLRLDHELGMVRTGHALHRWLRRQHPRHRRRPRDRLRSHRGGRPLHVDAARHRRQQLRDGVLAAAHPKPNRNPRPKATKPLNPTPTPTPNPAPNPTPT